jgi:hypothetical protein
MMASLDRRSVVAGMLAALFSGVDLNNLKGPLTAPSSLEPELAPPGWSEVFDMVLDLVQKEFGKIEPGGELYELCIVVTDHIYPAVTALQSSIERIEIITAPASDLDARAREVRMLPTTTIVIKPE